MAEGLVFKSRFELFRKKRDQFSSKRVVALHGALLRARGIENQHDRCAYCDSRSICTQCGWLILLEQRMKQRANSLAKNRQLLSVYEAGQAHSRALDEALRAHAFAVPSMLTELEQRINYHSAALRDVMKWVAGLPRESRLRASLMAAWSSSWEEEYAAYKRRLAAGRETARDFAQTVHNLVENTLVDELGDDELYRDIARDIISAIEDDLPALKKQKSGMMRHPSPPVSLPAPSLQKGTSVVRTRSILQKLQGQLAQLAHEATTFKVDIATDLPRTWNALSALYAFLESDDDHVRSGRGSCK